MCTDEKKRNATEHRSIWYCYRWFEYEFVKIELDGGVRRSRRLDVRNDDEVNIVLKTIALILEHTFKSMSRTNSLVNVDSHGGGGVDGSWY